MSRLRLPIGLRRPLGKIETTSQRGQLLHILDNIKAHEKIYHELLIKITEQNQEKFPSSESVRQHIDSAKTNAEALGIAKLIDRTFGTGTFRTLSFLDAQQNTARSVYRLLKNTIESTSFEKQVEQGYYLNLLETYGVQWNLEKTSRDVLQNFFDANGQTLDGVHMETQISEVEDTKTKEKRKVGKLIISSNKDYDWKELIHFGGTTKGGSETDVGGFGEGLKIAAFVLLKEHNATGVKASSRNWELEYYFRTLNSDAYRTPIRGLHAKKRSVEHSRGNSLEITFEGEDIENKMQTFIDAQSLFFSSENPDFQGASFDSRESGGFSILPQIQAYEGSSTMHTQRGHLYVTGQRIHYEKRVKWETVEDVHLWTWKKIPLKDRDRGMITKDELREYIIPMIVDSMTIEDCHKSIYDFQPLWDCINYGEPGYRLLEAIVKKLAKNSIQLEFPQEYLADDLIFCFWIRDALKGRGFRMCPDFMKDIGMKSGVEQFKEWQSHSRIEATEKENKKITILKTLSKEIGLEDNEILDIWLFGREAENSIIEGQYQGMFYWMSQESLQGSLLDALHTYVHEAAHKKGPHGDSQFEYQLQWNIQKIQTFILEHRDEWSTYEQQWNA